MEQVRAEDVHIYSWTPTCSVKFKLQVELEVMDLGSFMFVK